MEWIEWIDGLIEWIGWNTRREVEIAKTGG
jgi:hypothetical protein